MSQSIIELYQEQSLIDSCIALQAQIEECESLIAEDKKWRTGINIQKLLLMTAEALLKDSENLQAIRGQCKWAEEKKQLALSILRSKLENLIKSDE